LVSISEHQQQLLAKNLEHVEKQEDVSSTNVVDKLSGMQRIAQCENTERYKYLSTALERRSIGF
jgi:hypothetical protein